MTEQSADHDAPCGVLWDPNERVTGRAEFFHRCALPSDHAGDHATRVTPPAMKDEK